MDQKTLEGLFGPMETFTVGIDVTKDNVIPFGPTYGFLVTVRRAEGTQVPELFDMAAEVQEMGLGTPLVARYVDEPTHREFWALKVHVEDRWEAYELAEIFGQTTVWSIKGNRDLNLKWLTYGHKVAGTPLGVN